MAETGESWVCDYCFEVNYDGQVLSTCAGPLIEDTPPAGTSVKRYYHRHCYACANPRAAFKVGQLVCDYCRHIAAKYPIAGSR